MTPTDEQVETVGRALAACDAKNGRDPFAHYRDYRANWDRMARAAIAALPPQDWQDIASAPKDGTRVLLWMEPVNDARFKPIDGRHTVIATWVVWSDAMKRDGMRDGWSWYGSPLHYPTKWMALPAPPAAELERKKD